MGDSEDGNVLDVWIVLWIVCDKVMDVVVEFPPASAQATHVRRNEHGNSRIGREVMCYAHVASIVNSESELMPEACKWNRTRDVPSCVESTEKKRNKRPVSQAFNAIRGVVAIVEASRINRFLKLTVFPCDFILRLWVC